VFEQPGLDGGRDESSAVTEAQVSAAVVEQAGKKIAVSDSPKMRGQGDRSPRESAREIDCGIVVVDELGKIEALERIAKRSMKGIGRKGHARRRCIVVLEVIVVVGDEEDRSRPKADAVDRRDLIIADRGEGRFVRRSQNRCFAIEDPDDFAHEGSEERLEGMSR